MTSVFKISHKYKKKRNRLNEKMKKRRRLVYIRLIKIENIGKNKDR